MALYEEEEEDEDVVQPLQVHWFLCYILLFFFDSQSCLFYLLFYDYVFHHFDILFFVFKQKEKMFFSYPRVSFINEVGSVTPFSIGPHNRCADILQLISEKSHVPLTSLSLYMADHLKADYEPVEDLETVISDLQSKWLAPTSRQFIVQTKVDMTGVQQEHSTPKKRTGSFLKKKEKKSPAPQYLTFRLNTNDASKAKSDSIFIFLTALF